MFSDLFLGGGSQHMNICWLLGHFPFIAKYRNLYRFMDNKQVPGADIGVHNSGLSLYKYLQREFQTSSNNLDRATNELVIRVQPELDSSDYFSSSFTSLNIGTPYIFQIYDDV
jgi:hypothetical protein